MMITCFVGRHVEIVLQQHPTKQMMPCHENEHLIEQKSETPTQVAEHALNDRTKILMFYSDGVKYIEPSSFLQSDPPLILIFL